MRIKMCSVHVNDPAEAFAFYTTTLGIPTIVFGVPDVHAEYERLSAAGVQFKGPPTTDPSGTSAVFHDNCGNLVQIHQD
ncbi:MAG TPA: VOC family protein [Aeromicrobium sp.]|nr:VOC family protein [Aeromicrobium sp.]